MVGDIVFLFSTRRQGVFREIDFRWLLLLRQGVEPVGREPALAVAVEEILGLGGDHVPDNADPVVLAVCSSVSAQPARSAQGSKKSCTAPTL